MQPIKTNQQVRYQFNTDEKLEKSEQLANCINEKTRIEGTKRSANSQFKNELDSIESKLDQLADQVSTGYEVRGIECTVELHTPGQGQKTIRRDDTGEVVGVYQMDSSELQMALTFDEPAPEFETLSVFAPPGSTKFPDVAGPEPDMTQHYED